MASSTYIYGLVICAVILHLSMSLPTTVLPTTAAQTTQSTASTQNLLNDLGIDPSALPAIDGKKLDLNTLVLLSVLRGNTNILGGLLSGLGSIGGGSSNLIQLLLLQKIIG